MAKDRDKPFRPFRKQRLPPHRYECLFCESQFRWNRDLEAHMNTHTNERPHFCDKCPAAYPNASYLGVHKKTQHDKKKYKCDFCGSIFKSLGTLCSHRRFKHKVKPKRGQRTVVTPKSCTMYPNDYNSSTRNHPKRQTSKNSKDVPKKRRGRPPKMKSDPPQPPPQIKIEPEPEEESPPLQSQLIDQDQKVTSPSSSPPCFKRRLINRYKKDDFNEPIGYYGYTVPPAPPITIPPEIPSDLVPFYAVLNIQAAMNRSKNSEWDSSFFLHMNRYDPQQDFKKEIKMEREEMNNDSNSRAEHSKIKRRPRQGGVVKREVLKSKQMDGGGGFRSIKRGRPRKDSDDQDVMVKVEVKDMIDVKDWEILEGGQKAKCPYCERVMFRNNVHSHALVHTGEKPFKCKFCEKTFRQKSHVIKHIIRYHRYGHGIGQPGVRKTPELLKEAEENLNCAFCGKKFEDKWNLEQHLLKIHNDEYK